ncbi:probable histone-lysine N-methyltransferase CG1716 [Drosophila nasuta]|uniref:probable histone-lysine N-methyltransferase CG1716 n=1 Tax=Drosophila nasuta TaxID=42062 RepID=UPI00295F2DAD|nr:probable histone-lysine N-methyltransferase CG1716 [Drosophila nasuta]
MDGPEELPPAAPSPKPRKRLKQHSNKNNAPNGEENETVKLLEEMGMEDAEVDRVSPASKQYRRSARKKTIKFDVRDLLKKNRKNHKTQIVDAISKTANNCPVGSVDKHAITTAGIDAINELKSITSNNLPIRAIDEHSIDQFLIELQSVGKKGQSLPRNVKAGKQPRVRLKDVAHSDIGKAATARYNSNNLDSETNSTTSFLAEDAGKTSCCEPRRKLRVLIKRMTFPLSEGCIEKPQWQKAMVAQQKNKKEDDRKESIELDNKLNKPKIQPETDANIDSVKTKTEMTVDSNDDSSSREHQLAEEQATETKTVEAEQILTKNDKQQLVIQQMKYEDKHLTKRRSKRFNFDNLDKKLTLEETFAQIAAKSTQSIQKTELQNSSHNNDLSINLTNNEDDDDDSNKNEVSEQMIQWDNEQDDNKESAEHVIEMTTTLPKVPKPNDEEEKVCQEVKAIEVEIEAKCTAGLELIKNADVPITSAPCIPALEAEDDAQQAADDAQQAADDAQQAADDSLQAADDSQQAADDSRQAADYTQQAADYTQQAADNSQQAAEDSHQATDDSLQAVDDSRQAADDSQQVRSDSQQTVDDSRQAADDSRQAADYTQQAADNSQQAAEDSQQATDDSLQTVDDSQQAADYTQQAADSSQQAAEDSQQATDDSLQAVDDSRQAADDSQQVRSDSQQTVDDSRQAADDSQQAADDTHQVADDSLQAVDDSRQAADDSQQTADDSQQAADDTHQVADDSLQATYEYSTQELRTADITTITIATEELPTIEATLIKLEPAETILTGLHSKEEDASQKPDKTKNNIDFKNTEQPDSIKTKSDNQNTCITTPTPPETPTQLHSKCKGSKVRRSKAHRKCIKAEKDERIGDETLSESEANTGLPTPTTELDAEESSKFVKQEKTNELAQHVANIETPATTPINSPQDNDSLIDSSLATGAVRRSHRIKRKKPTVPTVRLSGESCEAAPALSMAEQLAQLAEMDVVNAKFMRDEGLSTFQLLRDNYYRCARQVSEENAEMQCDCEDALLDDHQCCGNGCINRMLMIECGPLCSNGRRCTNKRFQLHQCWPCRVFRTEKKGCGITAELTIPPGEFIMEYVGEVIDSEEFERRQHSYSLDRNRHYYFMALRGEAIIDATAKGNISRYINHSCDPNAETQKWTVNGELRIGFFSVKRIEPGEEITFDYQYQRYGRDAQRCYCEADNCRGWIGGEPDTEADEGEQLVEDEEPEQEDEEEQEQESDSVEDREIDKVAHKSKLLLLSKNNSSNKLRTKPTKQLRKSRIKPKDREYKAGRWLRPTTAVAIAAKQRNAEDPDVLEQLSLLRRSGLKNQADTLRFSRCMVRAKLQTTRLQLLQLLAGGELPCRRLFLDYHGLRLLYAWISDSQHGHDAQLRTALLVALDALPISNRTMLNDSRIYQSVQSWNSDDGGDAVASQLLVKWSALPEVFRIPKRERIEQMKEHERAADGHVTTALEDSHSNSAGACATFSSDPYRQDRFRRDQQPNSSRYDKQAKPSPRLSSNSNSSNGMIEGNNLAKSEARRRCDPRNNCTMSKELRRSLFERKVAKDEAQKREFKDERREHEMRCEFFGADLNTEPKQLPFYQNIETRQWYNSYDEPVATPKRLGDAVNSEDEVLAGANNASTMEYRLPPEVEPLPLSWTWSMTPDGSIYYYHLRDRVPQWEPPNAEQRKQRLVEDDELPSTTTINNNSSVDQESVNDHDTLVAIDDKLVSNMNEQQLANYIDVKTKERHQMRLERLVSVRTISPVPEVERVHSQPEAHKYKENKEIIRRHKEDYHRHHNAVDNQQQFNSNRYEKVSGNLKPPEVTLNPPISSSNGLKELPANEQLKLIPHLSLAESSPSCSKTLTLSTISKLPMPPLPQACYDHDGSMKRKLPESQPKHCDREKKRREPLSSTASGREACEKFRSAISGLVAEYLRPFRKESCQLGRITSDDDYKYLIKRLSQHITTKEMRCCDSTGNPMIYSDSVKYKSYEFIKQYMRQKGRIYERPETELDY